VHAESIIELTGAGAQLEGGATVKAEEYETAKPTAKSPFRDMQEVKQTQFDDCYTKSNPCARFFFMYMNGVIRDATANNNKLTD